MRDSKFPTLLEKQATLFGGLTRFDLAFCGGIYLILSIIDTGGIVALIVNVSCLFVVKMIQKRIPSGFFRFLTAPRKFSWAYKLKDLK